MDFFFWLNVCRNIQWLDIGFIYLFVCLVKYSQVGDINAVWIWQACRIRLRAVIWHGLFILWHLNRVFFTRTGDSATLSRQNLKACLTTVTGKWLCPCQNRTAVCLIARERAGTLRVMLSAGLAGVFCSWSVLADSAGWVTWLRHLCNGSQTRLTARYADISSQTVSGNECFLKMQMTPAEGKQVRELDYGHFFSPVFTTLLFVASPLQGILTGTDKPLYGLNWIGSYYPRYGAAQWLEIKDFIHSPSAHLSFCSFLGIPCCCGSFVPVMVAFS